MARIVWQFDGSSHEHELGAVTTIGRSSGSDVRILERSVSATHARITREDDDWIIEDLKSRNGTSVNGKDVDRCVLADGDIVGVGGVDLAFRMSAGEAVDDLRGDSNGGWTVLPAGAEETVAGIRGLRAGNAEIVRMQSVDSNRASVMAVPDSGEDAEKLAMRLKVSYEISRAVTVALDPAEVMEQVLSALLEIFEPAQRAFIILVDPETGEVSTGAVKWRDGIAGDDIVVSETALAQVLEKREALLCLDTLNDERFSESESVAAVGIRSMMIAPLLFQDQLHGVIHVDRLDSRAMFSSGDLELLSLAGGEVAACVANAHLHRKVVAAERLAAVGQTVAGLSHCIKNILQCVKFGGFLVQKGLDEQDFEHVAKGWNLLKTRNSFMEELVLDLLSLSKPREPEYDETDVNAVCAEICSAGREEDVKVTFRADPALESAVADEKGLRRCVLNLVGNAVDACVDSGGEVTVETHSAGEDGMFRIVIRDTGCGMSEETQAKLFTFFFSTKGAGGTGLGLPVTRKILEEHGGRLDMRSREGEGTEFTIVLPVKPVRD
jgi:signal transduction histidine kinase